MIDCFAAVLSAPTVPGLVIGVFMTTNVLTIPTPVSSRLSLAKM